MVSKADLTIAVLILAGTAIGISYDLYLGAGSSVSAVLLILAFAYTSYWAFGIRHALAVERYKNQALGIGLIAIALGLIILNPGNPSTVPGVAFLQALPLTLLEVFTFYWVDASVLASRRSDPLLRDTFRWRRLRFVLWAIIIIGA